MQHLGAICGHLTVLIMTDYEGSMRRRRRKKGKQQQVELSCLLPSCPAAAPPSCLLAQVIAWCTTTEVVRRQLHQGELWKEAKMGWTGAVAILLALSSGAAMLQQVEPNIVHIFFFSSTF